MVTVKNPRYIMLATLTLLIFLGFLLYVFDFEKYAVAMIYIISSGIVLSLLIHNLNNFIFVSRLFLLYIVGAYPLAVKLIDENFYFSVFEFSTQSLEIAVKMYALTLIALPGCYLGWIIGRNIRIIGIGHKIAKKLKESDFYHRVVFYSCLIFAILAGYIIVIGSTGTILGEAYGSGTEGDPAIGSAGAIGGIALSVMLYCALNLRQRKFFFITLFIGAYLFIWCQILRGLRQDVVSASFSLIVIYLIQKEGCVRFRYKYLLYFFPVAVVLELWGLVRTGLHSWLAGEINLTELFDLGLGNAASVDGTIYSGTLGPITTTFANTVYLVKENIMEFIYGQGYIDYIFRTPPQFLYPDRPKDYALIFGNYGLSSGGGFFELAEAYLNFGILGVFFVPLIISLIISFFYNQMRRGAGMFYVFGLSSLLCVWLRGAWYQTFAFYKSLISACILFGVIYIIFQLFLYLKKNRYSKIDN